MSGGYVEARGGDYGAGIGGGLNGHPRWGTYAINGGDITVIAGEECNGRNADEGSAIGNGYGAKGKNTHFGPFTFGDKCKVVAGDNADNTGTFTAEERVSACIWRNYVHIAPCNHSFHRYEYIDDNTHRYYCEYCKSDSQIQEHNYGTINNPHDCACGKKYNKYNDRDEILIYTPKTDGSEKYDNDKINSVYVLKGQSYRLPEAPEMDGWRFMGYVPPKDFLHIFDLTASFEMRDDDVEALLPAGTIVTVDKVGFYYPRYRKIYREEWTWNVDYDNETATASVKVTNSMDSEDTRVLTATVTNNTKKATDTAPGELNFTATASFEADANRTYQFSNSMQEVYYLVKDITLDAAADDNSEILEEYDDMGVNVTMNNLTLKKDGKLHALTLPFSTKIAGSPLEGATVYAFESAKIVNKQLQVKFSPVTDAIEAGMPYFVKWTSGSDIENPTFQAVYLKNQTMGVQERDYEFRGTYDMLVADDDTKGMAYILNDDEQLEQSDWIDGFSNYFLICEDVGWDANTIIHTIQLNFNDEQIIYKRISYGFKGKGTAENPFWIQSRQDMKDMAAAFNGEYADELKGKYFRQERLIQFDEDDPNDYTPITNFTGHYDGANHSISGLNLNKTGSDHAALFITMADGSSLKNLFIRNSTFTGSSAAPFAINMDGNASIDNCHVLKDVTVTSNNYFAAGVAANMRSGTASVKNCSSQAAMTAHQSSAAGVVASVQGNVENCLYLGNSLTHSNGAHSKAIAFINNGSVENCYYIAPTLSDANAKLMPTANEDNTAFLELLHQRDAYLLNYGFANERINYDLTLNGRKYKATQQADGTWKSKAFTISLPFDMEIPKELQEDILVYKLLEIDTNKKEFIFTNEFPLMRAGVPYIVVINKGSLTFQAKNVLAQTVPMEPEMIKNADGSKELGHWCANFRKLDNDELIEHKAYIIQNDGMFKRVVKKYSNVYVSPFHAYFSALEELPDLNYQIKFIPTQNGEEIGDVTDFPADEFDFDSELDDATGIKAVDSGQLTVDSGWWTIDGRKLSGKPNTKGVYINNGRKVVIK